ncbi:hypothetical protein ONZ45_g12834 [Pleurotus djamor]|nr:hypothetical protein ONZ45_g12834 [Pleurotus djamor]
MSVRIDAILSLPDPPDPRNLRYLFPHPQRAIYRRIDASPHPPNLVPARHAELFPGALPTRRTSLSKGVSMKRHRFVMVEDFSPSCLETGTRAPSLPCPHQSRRTIEGPESLPAHE